MAFKAYIMDVKAHYQQKVCARQVTIPDAYNRCFKTDITVFMPKLTPTHQKPCCFLHMKNRYGRCFARSEHILVLASYLEELASTLRNNIWIDKWERMEEVSESLIADNLYIDENYIDMELFKQDIQI